MPEIFVILKAARELCNHVKWLNN